MVSWSEAEPKYKLLIITVAGLVVAGAIWFVLIRPTERANRSDSLALAGKRAEIAQLLPFQARMNQLNRDIENYRQQVEQQRQIVPEDKQVDSFIRNVQSEARASGIEIRRFTALPIVTREFYSEVPFELELDGPYFGVVHFYERMARMDRLVNVSGLQMSNVKTPAGAKAKKVYQYAPSETVVATCTASAFFLPPPAANVPASTGKPPLPVKK
jgi:type IV pilus assembly protein PilO